MTGRADVAGAGLLILAEALEALGADAFVYSPGGLRHGLVLEATGAG
jgi:exopolyphosphatase/pppGpp-phosphohydrolase